MPTTTEHHAQPTRTPRTRISRSRVVTRLSELLEPRAGDAAGAGRVLPGADRADRPDARRVHLRARRARTDRGRRSTRAAACRRARTAARDPDRGEGQRRPRRRGDHPRQPVAAASAATADSEVVRRLRAAGAIDARQDRTVRAGGLGPFHELRGVRDHAQPVEARPQPGRLERRQRRRGRRGPGADRARIGRRRLDPDPFGVLRAVRAQAPAWPDPARAAGRSLVRMHGARGARAQRSRCRAVRRRDQRAVLDSGGRSFARRRRLVASLGGSGSPCH